MEGVPDGGPADTLARLLESCEAIEFRRQEIPPPGGGPPVAVYHAYYTPRRQGRGPAREAAPLCGPDPAALAAMILGEPELTRRCAGACGELLPITLFCKNSGEAGGRSRCCKDCEAGRLRTFRRRPAPAMRQGDLFSA